MALRTMASASSRRVTITGGDARDLPGVHLDPDDCLETRAHGHATDLLGVGDTAIGSHQISLAVLFDIPGTGADVVALQGLEEVPEREAVRYQLHGIGLDMILLDVTADRIELLRRFEIFGDH